MSREDQLDLLWHLARFFNPCISLNHKARFMTNPFDRSKLAFYDFGPMLLLLLQGSLEDRFISQVGGVRSQDGEIVLQEV